jgi:anti-anti-sigma regulatory factor
MTPVSERPGLARPETVQSTRSKGDTMNETEHRQMITVTAPGRLSDAGAGRLHRGLLAAGTQRPVTIDMTSTAYYDHIIVELMVWIRNWLRHRDSDLQVVAPPPLLGRLELAAHNLELQRKITTSEKGIKIFSRDNTPVVSVRDLDIGTAGLTHFALMQASLDGSVILDLTGTRFLDCTGMLPVRLVCKWLRTLGNDVRIACPNPWLRRVLGYTRDDQLFEIFDTVAGALRKSQGGAPVLAAA